MMEGYGSKDSNSPKNKQESRSVVDDFKILLATGEYADFKIITEDETFNVHSLILKVRSPYFKALFNGEWKEKEQGQITVKHSRDAVAAGLRYIYTGDITYISMYSLEILGLACEWSLKELQEVTLQQTFKVLNHYVDNQIINVPQLVRILKTASLYGIKELERATMNFLSEHREEIRSHKEWKAISTDPTYLSLFVNFFEDSSAPSKRSKLNP